MGDYDKYDVSEFFGAADIVCGYCVNDTNCEECPVSATKAAMAESSEDDAE